MPTLGLRERVQRLELFVRRALDGDRGLANAEPFIIPDPDSFASWAPAVVKTSNYTLTDGDQVIYLDNTSSSVTITLPTAVGRTGKTFTIIKVSPYTAVFTSFVATTGGQKIGTSDRVTLINTGDVLTIVSDGSNWVKLDNASRTSATEWFVGGATNNASDGLTPGTAFLTLDEAITAAADGHTIYVAGTVALPAAGVTINKKVKIIGLGRQQLIEVASAATSLSDIALRVTVDNVHLENLEFRGRTTWKGVMLAEDVVSNSRLVNILIQGTGSSGTPTLYPLVSGTGTGVGGIGILKHRGEGCYYEQLRIAKCSVGLAVGNEASTNEVNRMVFAACCQELVMGLNTGTIAQVLQPQNTWTYGGGNGGGWTFVRVKSTAPTLVDNTPVINTIDLIGDGTAGYAGANNGANTFVDLDASEGTYFSDTRHPRVRVGSAANTFIHPTSAPSAVWVIDGNLNEFVAPRILGSGWLVQSHDNSFDSGSSNGLLNMIGNRNRARKISFGKGPSPAYMIAAFTGSDNVYDDCTYSGVSGGTSPPDITFLGTTPRFVCTKGVKALTYGATITTDVRFDDYFTINATNGTLFTISNPTDSSNSNNAIMQFKEITYDIKNSSGGALGAITWGAAFKLDATGFVNPANTKRKTIRFMFDGTNWVQVGPTSADI